jgi:secreted trypsin-like serine protease
LYNSNCDFSLETSQRTQVILGAHTLLTDEPSQQRMTVQAAQYIPHPDYVAATMANDIAILTLPGQAVFNEFVQPLVLPTVATDLFQGQLATISGWGATSATSPVISPVLRQVENQVISNNLCQARFGVLVTPTNVCTESSPTGSACNGDSGGPLTIGTGNTTVQIGVFSFMAASGCASG